MKPQYQCVQCGDEEYGEADCLKHADKYGDHYIFTDLINGGLYNPYKDEELQ